MILHFLKSGGNEMKHVFRTDSGGLLSLGVCLLFTSVSGASAQDLSVYTNTQLSSIAETLDVTLEEAHQRATQELYATQQTVEFLTTIDPDTGLSQAYALGETTGLAEDMAAYSQHQTETIENYTAIMQLRTENLSNLWEERNWARVSAFLDTGSLYEEIEDLPMDSIFDDLASITPDPDYFPGFYIPAGGFFSQANN